MFSSLGTVFLAPLVGMLTQRYGARRVALVAAPLSALTFGAVGSYDIFMYALAGLLVLAALVAATFGRFPAERAAPDGVTEGLPG